MPYFDGLGVLDSSGDPLHREGVSLARPELVFVGLEWQRSPSSHSLRGVGRDAVRMARHLASRLSRR